MAKIKKSITINAPIEKISGYLTEPANWPEFWPSMVECSGVQRSPDGAYYTKSRWVYKMAGMRLEGESDTTEYVANQRITTQSKSGIENITRWILHAEGSGTNVTFEIEYTVPVPVMGKLAEAIIVKSNEHEAETLMANLKARMEA